MLCRRVPPTYILLPGVDLPQLYCLDANAVAQEVGLGRRVNMVMQAAFFALSGVVDMEEVGIGCGYLGSILMNLVTPGPS